MIRQDILERLKEAAGYAVDASLLYDWRREILAVLSDLEEAEAIVALGRAINAELEAELSTFKACRRADDRMAEARVSELTRERDEARAALDEVRDAAVKEDELRARIEGPVKYPKCIHAWDAPESCPVCLAIYKERTIRSLLSDLEEEQARVSRLTRENEEALARIDTLTNRANTAEARLAELDRQSPFDDQIVFTQDFEPGAKDAE